jgi:glutamate racemase
MQVSNGPIAVFDSGLGSLSVIRELKSLLPLEDLIYLADTENFPYGTKTSEDLRLIMKSTVESLESFGPKLIIVASYTPSVQHLSYIKKCTSVPILGIGLPLAQAVKLTKTKHIGIMATQSALQSTQLQRLIAKTVPQRIFVTQINASPLIDTIEDCSFLDNVQLRKSILESTFESINDKIDVIVLSSTHLPLIKDNFFSLYSNINFIDSAKNAAKDAKKWLLENGILKKGRLGKTRIFVTGDSTKFQQVLARMGIRYRTESFHQPSS